jgi:hypothetical protein
VGRYLHDDDDDDDDDDDFFCLVEEKLYRLWEGIPSGGGRVLVETENESKIWYGHKTDCNIAIYLLCVILLCDENEKIRFALYCLIV